MSALRNRPEKDNPVHIVTKITDHVYTIKRLKKPLIEVEYNALTKEGRITSFAHALDLNKLIVTSVTGEVFEYLPDHSHLLQADLDAALKKAIAWAKHNIKRS